ncbi:MAG: prolyl oligopeptidase family protein [bacterium]
MLRTNRKLRIVPLMTLWVALTFFLNAVTLLKAIGVDEKKPPETRRDNVKEILHGVEIIDPYRWLEEQNSPETRAWIDAENAYTQSMIGTLPGRDKIEHRLTELMKIDVINRPLARHGRYFFTKRLADQDLSVIYMRQGLRGEDQVLIDPHGMSADHTTSVNLQTVSNDGTLLVYGIRQGGEDEISVHILDIDKKQELPDRLPRARYFGISVLPDNSGYYYTRFGPKGPRIYFHKMGTDPGKDRLIFGEGYDSGKIIFARLSDDGRYLLIHVLYGSAASKTEVYFQNLASGGQITPVVNDIDARFIGAIAGDELFLQTNWQAPNKRILSVDLKQVPQNPGEWREVIPTSKATISGFSLAGGKLFVNTLENVVSKVKVYEPDGRFVQDIEFPTIGTVGNVSGQWDSEEAFFTYSSFLIPTTIYRYDVAHGTKDIWARTNVPITSDNFEVKQVWYKSKDGTRIPMFLVHSKGLKLDGSNPSLLTGYGGFNISLTASFSSLAAIWVENGGVFARPSLRGGGEFGEEWHQAGMRANKQNVFDDFIAAAEWLIQNGYTKPSKLAISGGSNGGLLVGAALTQRPDLFKAVVCTYPLLDMVRYHKFLVAKFWVPEYGSSDDAEQFKYILKYSPYQNVKQGTKYPAVLFITGDSDTRVAPLHARKMAALLQASTVSENPVLLLYDTKSGHSGGRPVSKRIEEFTDWLSFLAWQLGMSEEMTSK